MVRKDNPNYKMCIKCGERMTKDASGLCCLCRRKKHPQSPCKICGKRMTSDPSGVCSECRRKRAIPAMNKMKEQGSALTDDFIDALIKRSFDELTLLRYYKEGRSAQEIGDKLGMTRHQVTSTLRRLIGARLFDSIYGDQEVVSSDLSQTEKDKG